METTDNPQATATEKETLPPEVHALAAECGLIMHKGGMLGWIAYDGHTGYPVTDQMGMSAALFAVESPIPQMFNWDMMKQRRDMLRAIADGTLSLAEARVFGGDAIRALTDSEFDPEVFTEELVSRAVFLSSAPLMPPVLWAFHEAGASPEVIGPLVGNTWSSSEYPDNCLDHESWAELFAAAGFRSDGEPSERPTEAVRLWRGSVPERRTDWSWTDNYDVAHQFAHQRKGYRPPGKVWTALVPPEALLARNTQRGESEWIANVAEHLIEEDNSGCTC